MESIDLLIENLIKLTIGKEKYYENIYDVTKEQAKAIKSDDSTKIEDYINKKQHIIEKVDNLDEQFNLIFIKLKEILKVNDLSQIEGSKYPLFKNLQDEIVKVSNIGKKIQEIENQNVNNLKIQMDKVKTEINSINNSRKVNKTYGNPYSKPVDSYFFDTKK